MTVMGYWFGHAIIYDVKYYSLTDFRGECVQKQKGLSETERPFAMQIRNGAPTTAWAVQALLVSELRPSEAPTTSPRPPSPDSSDRRGG
jgi:hypothetical protein